MPTVDDLVISLTIKETGRLGRLQKQLDSLVGKKGRIGGIGSLVGGMMYIKRDLKNIQTRLAYLMPTEIPGQKRPKAMILAAKTASDLIDKNMEKYAEKFISSKQGVVKNFAKALGIKEEDLGEFFENKLQDWQYRLENIISGGWTSPSAQRFLARINDMISRKEMDVGSRKKLYDAIEASIGEFNAEVAILLEKIGIFAIPEFSLFKMTENVLKSIGDQSGALRLNMKDLQEASKITGSAEAEEAYRQIKNIANIPSLKDPLTYIEQDFKILGISKEDVKKKMFTEAGVMADPRLRAMIPSIIQVAARRGEAAGIPRGFAQAVKTVVDKAVGGAGIIGQFYQHVRPDLLLISDDVEKLTDLFGEDIAKQITEGFFQFSEFKKTLSQENADQFIKYQTYVGKRLFGLSSSIQESFKRFVPDILTKTLNIMQELAKAGAISKLSVAEKERIVEEAQKGTRSEELERWLNALSEEFLGTSGVFDEEDRERIKEIIHNLGLNPNWVDLPNWTQNIGDQIMEIRKQTEKIGTVESNELLEKFLELRDKLDITMTPENLGAFISGLTSAYHDIKGMPMPELEKENIKYSMLKSIVDMRITEWKTLQEKYAQFPNLIIETLQGIKNKTKEYQELKEAEWKKTLLGRMEDLIKSVSDYRNELRTTIGRKYTEAPQEKIPREF